MPISVYIDNNVWDFLFERKLSLARELPKEEFCLCITREAEFEIPPMPDDKRDFAERTIQECGILTDAFFGFYDEKLPAAEQRVGGLGFGRWITPEEQNFIKQQRTPLKAKLKRSKLRPDEADLSIAARATHSVVLSLDARRGPIKEAYKRGENVVYLKEFDASGLSLREFILDKLRRRQGSL